MPKKAVRRVRGTEEHWRDVLQRFESNGLSAMAFCRRNGIALSSFQRWRQRLGRPSRTPFVELVPAEAPSAGTAGWSLDLTLPNGASIRLRG